MDSPFFELKYGTLSRSYGESECSVNCKLYKSKKLQKYIIESRQKCTPISIHALNIKKMSFTIGHLCKDTFNIQTRGKIPRSYLCGAWQSF